MTGWRAEEWIMEKSGRQPSLYYKKTKMYRHRKDERSADRHEGGGELFRRVHNDGGGIRRR